ELFKPLFGGQRLSALSRSRRFYLSPLMLDPLRRSRPISFGGATYEVPSILDLASLIIVGLSAACIGWLVVYLTSSHRDGSRPNQQRQDSCCDLPGSPNPIQI